jgi:hypothetical protein
MFYMQYCADCTYYLLCVEDLQVLVTKTVSSVGLSPVKEKVLSDW